MQPMGNEFITNMLNSQRSMNNNSTDLRLSPDYSHPTLAASSPNDDPNLSLIVIKDQDGPMPSSILKGLQSARLMPIGSGW